MPYLDVVTNILRDQTLQRILEHVRIELLTSAFSGLSRTPIVPGYHVHVVWIGRKQIGVVEGVKVDGIYHLFSVVQAHDALGFRLGLGQRGQQQPGEDRDNGDDNQQFDEREAMSSTYRWRFRNECF